MSRYDRMYGRKPHFFFMWGLWFCYARGCMGGGFTREQAYQLWEKDVAKGKWV